MNSTIQTLRQWSWLKRSLLLFTLLTFFTSSFLFLTSPGGKIREWLAQTVITTQHRSWAWIFVGAERRDLMVLEMQQAIEDAAVEKQDLDMITIRHDSRKKRTTDELIKFEDIQGQFWKGKKMYVYDPKTIRVMTPNKPGEGEKISAMVTRTGAVAGVNGGGFDDPEGLGNGFAAIGAIISGGQEIFVDQDGSIPQHIVGFTKDGTLVVGKYNFFELRDMGISDAVSFYPRLIANGKPLITSGDGGWGRGPRTAVGQKADGTVIFLVIDGRQSHSVGATLKELQDLFLEEGVINAGNLDGGASSELVVDGKVLTKPSSRYGERRLPSAFLVYDDPSSVVANRVWDGVDKIDAGGSYDHPDFLREQAELKAKGLKNPTPTLAPPPAKSETEKPKTAETKNDTHTDQKADTKTDIKTDTKSDVKTEPKTEPAKPGNGTTQPADASKSLGTTPKEPVPAPSGTGGGGEPAKQPGATGGTTTSSPSPAPNTAPGPNNGSAAPGATGGAAGSGSGATATPAAPSGGGGSAAGSSGNPSGTTQPTTPTVPAQSGPTTPAPANGGHVSSGAASTSPAPSNPADTTQSPAAAGVQAKTQ